MALQWFGCSWFDVVVALINFLFCVFFPYFIVQYLVCFLSDFAINSLSIEREGGWLHFFKVFFLSCDCWCSVCFSHSAMGRSAVCDSGIS